MNYFDILLAKKLEDDRDPKVEGLSVSANGRYHEDGVVYDPVIVNVQPDLITKSITQNGTYTASSDNADGYSSVDVHVSGYKITDVSGLPSAIATFSDASALPMPNLKVSIEPVQSGSGDPSPENIRPISGWTEAEVSVINDSTKAPFFKGLLNGTYDFVDLGSLTWFKSGNDTFYARLPEHKVEASISPIKAISSNGMEFLQMPGSGNTEYIMITDSDYASYTAAEFKVAMNGVYLIYELATPITPTVTPSEINELYEEFGINGHTYTIDLDGTRYGGSLDVVSGVLTVDRGYADLGSLSWIYSQASGNRSLFTTYDLQGLYKSTGSNNIPVNAICEKYKNEAMETTFVSGQFGLDGLSSARLIICDNSYTDETSFKTAVTGQKLVYELATPTTIQLTPTAVKSLLGTNNLFTNTGDVVEASYWEEL